MGYEKKWTARTLFNPEGGYNLESIKEWPTLYEAMSGDVYTVSVPVATRNWWNGQLQFRTPINLDASHTYRLRVKLQTDKAATVTVLLRENENDAVEAFTRDVALQAGVSQTLNITNIKGVGVEDTKLVFHIISEDANLTLTLSNISLYDVTDKKELWVGTTYYNYCYYVNPNTRKRLPDMSITGRSASQTWTLADFDDNQWTLTPMPVGNDGYMPEVRTIWPGGDNSNYWIRRDFELAEVKRTTAYTLKVCHDDDYAVYVNGHLIEEQSGWTNGKNPVRLEIPSNYLQEGRNVIAVNQRQTFGGKFFDCGMDIKLNAYDEGDLDADPAKLQASEVQVANIDQFIDHSWNYGAWVELYNPTESRIGLSGLYVSDDSTNLQKHLLPRGIGVVPSKGYACLYFDHHPSDGGQYGEKAQLQIPFKLKADGGTLYLSQDGQTPSLAIAYPPAIARCSWARVSPESDDWGYNSSPTPGAANADAYATERLAAPEVNLPSQVFDEALNLRVTIPQGCTLYYTLNGSAPSPTNSSCYTDRTGSFFVSGENKTYRFQLRRTGYLPSPVVTRTFIRREKDYYLPIIAISTAPDNLYGDSIGIYTDGVNGIEGRNHGKSNRNMDWSRPANVEYITAQNQMVVNQETSINVSGGWSRHFLPSSLQVKANKLYEGANSFDYPFFADKPFNKYKQLLVRNGGNDNDNDYRGRVRDAITQQTLISNGFYVDAQAYQPVHLFLNNKYVGLLNLREPNNRFNGTANYGYDDDLMDAFEYSNGYFQMAGTRAAFDEWLNLSRSAADDAVYEQICQRVDIDEVINFWAAVTYIGCSDCLLNHNNVKGYRSLPDGKFHLTVLDQDWGWSMTNGVVRYNNQYGNDLLAIYNGMKQNAQFRRQFVDAYCILHGSVFTPERCQRIGDSIVALVEPALKWEGRKPSASWAEQKNTMISADARGQRIEALRQAYGLSGGFQAKISANIPQASLMLNNQPVPEAALDGVLFAPVTLTASAPAGYAFMGWRSNNAQPITLLERNAEWRYFDQGRMEGDAWRMPHFDDSQWASGPAPLGYYTGGQRDYATTLSYGNDAANKHIAYYFRRTVELPCEPESDDMFTFNFTADDGFVVYVNGAEAYRYLMPEGDITYDTYAVTYAPNNPDNGQFSIPASYFQKGKNTIAVEVHNNVPGSSDIYWASSLLWKTTSEGALIPGNQLTITKEEDLQLTAIFQPLPRQQQLAEGGTPVRINEVSASNGIHINEYGKRDDWMELYNTTDADIDLSGMYLSDKANNPEKYQLQAVDGVSTVIPAHGHLVVWASKRDAVSQLHAPFKLDNADGCFVSLRSADGEWTDILRYDEHDETHTFGRYPDGGKESFLMSRPTIKQTNTLTTYDFVLAELEQGESPDSITHTFALAEGWNWFSHNMASPVAVDRLKEDNVALRADGKSYVKDTEGRWQGNLLRLSPVEGYKVQAAKEHEVSLSDQPYDTSLPVAVQKGWNWIGCPLTNATTISSALAGYDATEGDMLVGQQAFAVYAGGEWHGPLTVVHPGQSYMLRCGRQQAFEWNALTRRRQSRRYAPDQPETWTIDVHRYPDVQPIVAMIERDGEPLTGAWQVAAFVGDECRGVASLEDGIAYLLVYGEEAEPVTFRVVDALGEVSGVQETFTFASLDAKGTLQSPFVLHIGDADAVEELPVSPTFTVVRYYDLQGRPVSRMQHGIYLQEGITAGGRRITRVVAN